MALTLGFLCTARPASARSETIVAAEAGGRPAATGADVAFGWSQDRAFQDVTLSVQLANGGGAGAGRAYLMHGVGPGTTEASEVARRYYSLPMGFVGMVALFSGLDLEPGRYWLVLSRPDDRFSYANVGVGSPLSLSLAPGTRYLGNLGITEKAGYPPASKFSETVANCKTMECLAGWGFVFSVTVRGAAELPPEVEVTAQEVRPADGNLLLNPRFDASVDDWAGFGTWDPRHDAGDNSHSGSLRLTHHNLRPTSCATQTQCFAVSPGTYRLSAKILALGGSPLPPNSGYAGVSFSFYSGTATENCNGYLKGSDPSPIVRQAQDTWATVTAGPLEAPREARSATVTLSNCATQDEVEVDFDDVAFERVVPPPPNLPQ